MFNFTIGAIRDRLDIVGGLAGCLAGVAIAYAGYSRAEPGTLEIGMAAVIASAIYLLFRTRIIDSLNLFPDASKASSLILNIIFFSAFAASIYLMHSSLYRPQLYFILTTVAASAVATEILVSNNRAQAWQILIKILLISFSLRYGMLYEYPGFYGVDPWWHSEMVESWIRSGHISPKVPFGYTDYNNFPAMHIGVIFTRIITLLSPKDSLFVSVGLPYVISTIFVFLLGQRLVNTRTGLLAALITSVNSLHIGWGALLVPTSLGIILFAFLSWRVIRGVNSAGEMSIIIFTILVLVVTHSLSSFVAAVWLSAVYIAEMAFKKRGSTAVGLPSVGFHLVAMGWVAILGHWMYTSYSFQRSFFDSVLGWFVTTLRTEVEFTATAFQPSVTPLGALNRTGFLMLVGLIVVGALFWLSHRESTRERVAVIAGTLVLSVVTFVTPLFNIENLVPGRWLPFISVLGAAIAAPGFLALARIFRSGIMQLVAVVVVFLAFSMFMLNSSGVNTYTPFYGKEYMQDPERAAFKESELRAVETIAEIYGGPVTTDAKYGSLPFETQIGRYMVKVLKVDGENTGLIVTREYALKIYEGYGETAKAGYENYLTTLSASRYNLVYSNGKVKGYLKK